MRRIRSGTCRICSTDVENINVTVLEKTTRKIAGQDGTCYKTKDNDDGTLSTVLLL